MNCAICTQPLRNGEMATRFTVTSPKGEEVEHVGQARCMALWEERNKGGSQ